MPLAPLKLCTTDNLQLAAILETPDGKAPFPLVVQAHGYNSQKNSQTNLAVTAGLIAKGIATLRFDFRGHGESQGNIEDVNITTGLRDLAAVIDWADNSAEIDQDQIGLMGSSYGGVVVTLQAAKHPNRIKCLALKAPATDWGEARTLQIDHHSIAEWQRRGYHQLEGTEPPITVPYSFYEDITSYDTYAAAERITCPVLIIHGDADRSVPVEQSRKLAKKLGGETELQVIPGVDHRFSKEADFRLMISQSTSFLATHLGT
ncbi:MAG TPA: alpha/beta fold hydrolase [Candidatus Saccharimonadales bacterium]|nr:alpha/beta fold hydrolase [Candidatus Saccharimonadales bacterium]